MNRGARKAPVLGFAAPSGAGKTTLLSRLVSLLDERGIRVGVVKQARDDFEVDTPGKDSYELRKAGAEWTLLASPGQTALIIEHPGGGDPRLEALLALLDRDALDLVLVEGFSRQPFPKIELVRQGAPRCYPHDPFVIAIATDRPEILNASVPVLDLDDPCKITEFVLAWAKETKT